MSQLFHGNPCGMLGNFSLIDVMSAGESSHEEWGEWKKKIAEKKNK
jgi:hypothetical protein